MPPPSTQPDPPPRKPPQSDPAAAAPLTADDRLVIMVAGIVAAGLVREMDHREYQGMRSPRFHAALSNALVVGRCLVARYKRELRHNPLE